MATTTIPEQPDESPTTTRPPEDSKPPAEDPKPTFDFRKIDWMTLFPFLIAAVLFGFLAKPMLIWWYWEYTKPESYYQHAPIIPAIVALMLWYRRDLLMSTPRKPEPLALFVLLPMLALFVFSLGIQAQAVMSATFLIVIWSGVWLALGNKFVRAAAFPLFFLILMAPLPGPLLNDSTLRIQMASTVLANKLLHLMTFNTNLSGNVITMDNFSLFVDVPCSGFKLLLSFLTFSAAFAYLVDGSGLRRLGLFLFSLPLSLFVNGVRIALIGVIGECMGASAAHVFHDWSGMITLILGFTALFSLAKVIGCRKFAGWDIF